MFTINMLELPSALRRCLGLTNVIESPNSSIRNHTHRVKNWQDAEIVVRWVAASLLDMEKRFRRIIEYQQLWILEAHLDVSPLQVEIRNPLLTTLTILFMLHRYATATCYCLSSHIHCVN